jgi:hypothetical protein
MEPLQLDCDAQGHVLFSEDKRPSFLRSVSNRRWTLAAAEHLADEDIAAELQRLRNLRARSNPMLDFVQPLDLSTHQMVEEDWIGNYRIVFVCRELLRTERNYLSSLEQMHYGKVSIVQAVSSFPLLTEHPNT